MPIQLNEENGGKILVVHISGKLVQEQITSTLCPSSSDSSGSTENCACCST